jgi:hypothetical protein
MTTPNPTETRIASVFKDENSVIVITMKDCGVVDEYDAVDLNLVIRHKCDQKPSLKLVIATANFDLSKKARKVAEKEDVLSKTKARAIVVSNNIKASVYNFMKQFDNKPYPQQFFTDKDEAYAWLLKFKESSLSNIVF